MNGHRREELATVSGRQQRPKERMKLDESGGKLRFRREEGGGGKHRVLSGWELSVVPNCHSSSDHQRRIPKLQVKRRDLFFDSLLQFFFWVEFLDRYRQNNFFGSTLFANFPTMGWAFFGRSGILMVRKRTESPQ
jgi:hypothetical protein